MTVARNKEYKELERLALEQGWTVEQGGKHIKWTSPTGEVITTGSTPGRSAYQVDKGMLEKAGLITNRAELRRVNRTKQVTGERTVTTSIDPESLKLPMYVESSIVGGMDPFIPEFVVDVELNETDDPDAIAAAVQEVQQKFCTDRDFAEQFYYLPSDVKELYIRTIARGIKPNQMPKECPGCKRNFPSPWGMLLHTRKCDEFLRFATQEAAEALGPPPVVDTEPLVPPDRRDSSESSVEEPADSSELTVAPVAGTIPVMPEQPAPETPPYFPCLEPGCTRNFRTELGLKKHVTITHGTTVVRIPKGAAPTEDDLDALLQLVTGGASIPMNMTALAVVNRWLEATKNLLALVGGE